MTLQLNHICMYKYRNKRNRSLYAHLRAGCLDLEIETGRWRGMYYQGEQNMQYWDR